MTHSSAMLLAIGVPVAKVTIGWSRGSVSRIHDSFMSMSDAFCEAGPARSATRDGRMRFL